MEKIKSVLTGHSSKKSEDAAHDESRTGDPPHPIFDEMTGHQGPTTTGTHPIASAPSSTAAHTTQADYPGKVEGLETSGSGGVHVTPPENNRPSASTLGAGQANEAFSAASIKSGVIGFGEERQEHAALPSVNNPAVQSLAPNQIVGGGDPTIGSVTAERADQSAIASQSSHPFDNHSRDTANYASNTPSAHINQTSSAQPSLGQAQPDSRSVVDSTRSFPLAGGVTAKRTTEEILPAHHPEAVSTHDSPATHASTIAGQPDITEKETGVRDSGIKKDIATVAGVSAAAAPSVLSKPRDDNVETLHARSAEQGSPTRITSPNTTTNNPRGNHAEAIAAAKVATACSPGQQHCDGAPYQSTAPEALSSSRPAAGRSASHPHVPGEFPSPTPDESRTFLYYRHDLVPEPGSSTRLTSGHHGAHDQSLAPSTAAVQSISNPAVTTGSGQHELRHTGSLNERPLAGYGEEDRTNQNVIAAGTATVSGAMPREHHQAKLASDTASPYNSTALDPRVTGDKIDTAGPQARATRSTSDRHGLPISSNFSSNTFSTSPASAINNNSSVPAGSVARSDVPAVATVQDTTPTSSDRNHPEHHLGRDAALASGGAASSAIGVRHTLQRNDTPATGTTVFPQDSVNARGQITPTTSTTQATAPVTSSAANTPETSARSPETTTTNVSSYAGPLTTSGAPFYSGVDTQGNTTSGKPHDAAATSANDRTSTTLPGQHHKDKALDGTAAAEVGGSSHASRQDVPTNSGPASKTIGPHSSNIANILDPRVQPDPSKQVHHQAGPTVEDPASRTIGPHHSNIVNIIDPRVQPDPSKQRAVDPKIDAQTHNNDHHHGRNAAVIGGTGAAGYGVHESTKALDTRRNNQSGAVLPGQQYNTTTSASNASDPLSVQRTNRSSNQVHGHNADQPSLQQHDGLQDHTNRNIVVGGAAAGAGAGIGAGAGALGGVVNPDSKHDNHIHQPTTQTAPDFINKTHISQDAGVGHGRYDSVQESKNDQTKRNADLAGAGGIASAGGAYEYSQRHETEKEQARLNKEQNKQEKKLEKEQAKHEEDEKKHQKQEEEHMAHVEKEQAKHEKEAKKQQRQEEKHGALLQKEQAKHDKEEKKQQKHEEDKSEKKHGILGFLHRDKTKREKHGSAESSPRQSGDVSRDLDSSRHSREYTTDAVASGAGVAATSREYEHEHDNPDSPRWKGKHLLHKDPPKGHPAREALENEGDTGLHHTKREHVGTDGPIGDSDAISGYANTGAMAHGAQPLNEISQNNKVMEPHTGLQMNVGRYGEGIGGTDANPAIAGHQTAPDASHTQHSATNWENVKKNDTAY